MKAIRITVASAAVLLALTACSSTGGKPRSTGDGMGSGQADTPRFTVAMVTHGPPGDTFWDLIRKGAETAAKKDNIELKYSAELQGPDQANLVQNAVDSKVNAIAVTLARPEALKAAVQSATAAGIPVVALNAGINDWQAAGAKAYFGQDEKISGEAAGKRLAGEGAKKVVCVIQDQGNVALESRCAGVAAGFGGRGGKPQRERHRHAVGPVHHHRQVAAGPGNRLHRHPGSADRADRRQTPPRLQAARRRSSPSTPTQHWSTRSRTARCSGPSTSSRSCRAISRWIRCGCT